MSKITPLLKAKKAPMFFDQLDTVDSICWFVRWQYGLSDLSNSVPPMNRRAKKQRHLRSLLEVAWCVYIAWHVRLLRHLQFQGSCCKRKIGFSKTWFREWYEALRRLRKAGNFWDHRCKSCQTCLDVGHLVKASATAAGWLRQIITWVKCMNII